MPAIEMDAIDIEEFLRDQHVGVLSLADGGDGYGIPVSYAYDADGPYVYLRLGYAPGSQKRGYVDASEYVSLVVCAETDAGWKSVVARGPIEERAASTVDSTVLESLENLDIPYFQVHDRPPGDLEFRITRIDVQELSGIVEG